MPPSRTAQRVLFGAFGSSSGTNPFALADEYTGPTLTDDLLPMMTLGWGDRLDRVAVRPDDRVARQQTPPAVVATHGINPAGCRLAPSRPAGACGDRRQENPEQRARSMVCRSPVCSLVTIVNRRL